MRLFTLLARQVKLEKISAVGRRITCRRKVRQSERRNSISRGGALARAIRSLCWVSFFRRGDTHQSSPLPFFTLLDVMRNMIGIRGEGDSDPICQFATREGGLRRSTQRPLTAQKHRWRSRDGVTGRAPFSLTPLRLPPQFRRAPRRALGGLRTWLSLSLTGLCSIDGVSADCTLAGAQECGRGNDRNPRSHSVLFPPVEDKRTASRGREDPGAEAQVQTGQNRCSSAGMKKGSNSRV